MMWIWQELLFYVHILGKEKESALAKYSQFIFPISSIKWVVSLPQVVIILIIIIILLMTII